MKEINFNNVLMDHKNYYNQYNFKYKNSESKFYNFLDYFYNNKSNQILSNQHKNNEIYFDDKKFNDSNINFVNKKNEKVNKGISEISEDVENNSKSLVYSKKNKSNQGYFSSQTSEFSHTYNENKKTLKLSENISHLNNYPNNKENKKKILKINDDFKSFQKEIELEKKNKLNNLFSCITFLEQLFLQNVKNEKSNEIFKEEFFVLKNKFNEINELYKSSQNNKIQKTKNFFDEFIQLFKKELFNFQNNQDIDFLGNEKSLKILFDRLVNCIKKYNFEKKLVFNNQIVKEDYISEKVLELFSLIKNKNNKIIHSKDFEIQKMNKIKEINYKISQDSNFLDVSNNFTNIKEHIKEQTSRSEIFSQIKLQEKSLIENPKQVFEQIINKASLIHNIKRSEMRIQLEPKILGYAQIKLVMDNGVLSGSFSVENQSVKYFLEDNLNLLKNSLIEKGLNLDQINISLSHKEKEWHLDKEQLFNNQEIYQQNFTKRNKINSSLSEEIMNNKYVNSYWFDNKINVII